MTLVEVYAGQRSIEVELIAFCCPAKVFFVPPGHFVQRAH